MRMYFGVGAADSENGCGLPPAVRREEAPQEELAGMHAGPVEVAAAMMIDTHARAFVTTLWTRSPCRTLKRIGSTTRHQRIAPNTST